jgi:hypothetical protein
MTEDDLFDMELFDPVGRSGGGGGCFTAILIAIAIFLIIAKLFS